MELTVNLSEEAIHRIAQQVAVINKNDEPLTVETSISSRKGIPYTVKEVAEMVKFSEGTVTRHIRNKLLGATKVGKSWKISEENYQKYIENENK